MDSTTQRTIDEIKANGYWEFGQTLGEGGWEEVYSFASNWQEYRLYNLDDNTEWPVCKITAESDEAAIKAFSELFHLGEFAHEIYKIEMKSTLILEQL